MTPIMINFKFFDIFITPGFKYLYSLKKLATYVPIYKKQQIITHCIEFHCITYHNNNIYQPIFAKNFIPLDGIFFRLTVKEVVFEVGEVFLDFI